LLNPQVNVHWGSYTSMIDSNSKTFRHSNVNPSLLTPC